MRLKSKGLIIIEAIIIIILVSIISLSISKFAINISYLSYQLHYQSKASILVSNFINILKTKASSIDNDILIEKLKKEVSQFLPNGKTYITKEHIKINWFDKKESSYIFKLRNSGFILIESIGYLFIINLILLSFLYLFNNLNNTYQLQTKLFSIDDSFNLAKSNIENDLKNSLDVKINDGVLYIKKQLNNELIIINYKVGKSLNKKLGLFRAENSKRFEEVVPYIESTSYDFYNTVDSKNKSKLLIIKLYAKIDNINDSTEFMLTL